MNSSATPQPRDHSPPNAQLFSSVPGALPEHPSRLAPNLGTTGRAIRAVSGTVVIVAGIAAATQGYWLPAAGLWLSGAFMLFEAARGWCALRACGIQTRW